MKRLIVLMFTCLSSIFIVQAQELNCNVLVNSDKITGTNKQIFISLQKSINEFVNNRRWTDLQYQISEKIDCSFTVIINEQVDEKTFKATIQVQARRPVFNTTYYSPLFAFKDDNFNFEYIEHSPIEYVEGTFSSNLTSVLSYYCYLIIGYDSDSFSKLGGTPYFSKAESIVNLAQSQQYPGWKAFEDSRNRYALMNNLLDENLRKFREFFYEYHRLGLDEMTGGVEKGRAKIASSILALREVNRVRPSCVALMSFLDAKRDEIINIFSNATPAEKKSVYDLLIDIDPSQSERYKPILSN